MSEDEDAKIIQHDLDVAQADLTDKVSQLKDLVDDKLETPKQVVNVLSFIAAHRVAIAAATVATFVAYGLVRRLLDGRR